jgi:hypothetical protein
VIERLRLERVEGERLYTGGAQPDDIEYRFGYYTVARNGKWWRGQSAPFIPEGDVLPLLQKRTTKAHCHSRLPCRTTAERPALHLRSSLYLARAVSSVLSGRSPDAPRDRESGL